MICWGEMTRLLALLLVASCGRVGFEAIAQESDAAAPAQVTTLQAPIPSPDALFGDSIVVGDQFLAVGTPHDDLVGSNAGAVYLFGVQQGAWQLEHTLTSPDASANQAFGESLAWDGTTLVVGANGIDEGAYVYVRDGQDWNLEGRLGLCGV